MLQDYKAKTMQSTDKWLKNTDKLKAYYAKQAKEQLLLSIISAESGIDERSFFISSSESNILVLQTNNGVIATQLRLASSQLLSQLSNNALWGGKFDSIKVNIRPHYHKQRTQQDKMRNMSEKNARLLEEVANYSENPKLKEVLLRIAKHRQS